MPKKSLKINQFHGGLNNYRDKRDAPDDALVNATNIMVDIPGKIRMMGRDIESVLSNSGNLNEGVIEGLTTPGYGLFAFSADHGIDGSNTQGSEFIVYQSQTDFNIVYDGVIYKLSGTAPYGSGGVTTDWSGSPKPDFLYGNERLFISDGDFSNVSSGDTQVPHVFEFLNNTLFSSGNSIALAAAGWYTNKASYPKPTDGNISAVANASVQVAAFTDQNIKITVENDGDGEGQWENQNIWLGISQLYGDEESRINTTGLVVAALAQGQGSLDLGFSISIDTTSPPIDKRTTGYKIYVLALNTGATPKYYKDPFLLATADMVNEELISHEGISVALDYNATSGGGDIKRYDSDAMLGIATLPTTTFEIENLYAHDVETIRAKWKTSTQIGNALYIGNVRTLDDAGNEIEVNPDKILRGIAPPNTKRMGIFPSSDFLDVTVGDGDEIVALESFADKLLVFKKKTLFVINVSGDIEYIELERKFVGIENPYNVAKTELGVAWVTPQGAFLYDGEKILNLIDGKLDPYIAFEDIDSGFSMPGWTTFIGSTGGGQVAYIPPLKQLVVMDSPINPDDNGTFFVYDFRTTSWTYSVGRIDNSPRSSVVSGHDESFLWLGSRSAPGNSTSSFIANIGAPALDYKARITNIRDNMETTGNATYQLMVNSITPLTNSFTYTESNGTSLAETIVNEMIYTSDSDTIEAVALSSNNQEYDIVEITFTAIGSSTNTPTIFGQELYWDEGDYLASNEAPSATLASFLQAGIGHSVAPVRAWYHGPSMKNLENHVWGDGGAAGATVNYSDDSGIMRNYLATWGGNTWSGCQPFTDGRYPKLYLDGALMSNASGWYTPFFTGQNMIYPWILNHLRMFIGQDPFEGKVNEFELHSDWNYIGNDDQYGGGDTTHFDNIGWLDGTITNPDGTSFSTFSKEVKDTNGTIRSIGSPWGYRGFHPSNYQYIVQTHNAGGHDASHIYDSDIDSGFNPQAEYEKRNTDSDLYSYTGMVIMPGGGITKRQSTNSWDLNNTAYAMGGGTGTDILTCLPSVRANPRLIRFMCDFSENLNFTNGDDFTLPNNENKGNYVSPGLIYTQAWMDGDSPASDVYFETLKNLSPNGNGHYLNDAGSQVDTPYPNGYHFFGFGKGAGGEISNIVEAIGGPAPLGGLEGNKFHSAGLTNNDGDGTLGDASPLCVQNGLFAGAYFIGRKIKWNDSLADQEDSLAYGAHKSIAKDVFESDKFRLFKNFGDMSFRGSDSWGNNEDGNSWSPPTIDGSTDLPSTLLRSGIPFNQQSIIGLGDSRENPITRDAVLFNDGSPNIISSICPGGDKNGYIRIGQSNPPEQQSTGVLFDRDSPGNVQLYDYADPGYDHNKYQEFVRYHNYDTDPNESTFSQPICYTSMPYLVIEVIEIGGNVDTIILHMICDVADNSGHTLGGVYNYTIKEATDDRDYSLSGLVLTGGSLIDLAQKERLVFGQGDPEAFEYDFDTIAPVDSRTWGLNGYLTLEFSYNSQPVDVQNAIDSSGMSEYGTAAFWTNPLKDEEANGDGSDTIENTKDPLALDYQNNSISGVSSSLSNFDASYSPFFQLLSDGQKGSKREVILHAKKGHTGLSADGISLSATVSKGSKNISVVNAGLKWDNETAADCDSIYEVMSSDSNNSILEKLPDFDNDLYESVANVKRTVDIHSITANGAPGVLQINSDETGYFRGGDAIWFETLPPTAGDIYLIKTIDYDTTTPNKTHIVLETDTNYTDPNTVANQKVYQSEFSTADTDYVDLTSGVDRIIYGTGIHFVGYQERSSGSPKLNVSGSFSGDLQVLTFDNSSLFVENPNNDNNGTFFFETKDVDFGNPSSLKNINYVDISMRSLNTSEGPLSSVQVKYAINNSKASNAWKSFPSHNISSDFKAHRYKLETGSIKNINSIRFKIYDTSANAKDFELNDITIVYREKQL